MIFEPSLESMDRTRLRTLQDGRVRDVAAHVYERVPFYRDRFVAAGLGPHDVRSVKDLTRLPLTRKSDLRDGYPFGLFAAPVDDMARIHASSGTTGKPTVVGYSRNDLEVFSDVCARALAMAGAEPGMMLHNAYGYGLFTGGLGLHYGAERLGMTVVPVSGGMTQRQLTLITDFRPDVISCTPSYALTLAQELRASGMEPEDISLRFAVLGAEPWTDAMRREVDAALGVKSANIYGLSEIIGPGVSAECTEARNGSHINEDHFYPEVVDDSTLEPLPEGEEGVLVFTTLTKRGMPLLRYFTGDIASLSSEPCACGRTLVRMSLIKGRVDDMLIVRGVNVYPTQVEALLGRFPELAPHYRIIVTRDKTLDEVEVQTEVTEVTVRAAGVERLTDEVVAGQDTLRALRDRIARLIKDSIGCSMTVRLMAPGETPRSEGGKLARVEDRRSPSA